MAKGMEGGASPDRKVLTGERGWDRTLRDLCFRMRKGRN